MKPLYLILFYLVLNTITTSAQIVADSLAKKLHIKTALETGYPINDKLPFSTRAEIYDTNGRVVERISFDNSADSAVTHNHSLVLRSREYMQYDYYGQITKKRLVFYHRTETGLLYNMDSAVITEPFSYNKNRQLTLVTENNFTKKYSYDKKGHIIEIVNKKQPPPGPLRRYYKWDTYTYQSKYKYDSAGRVTSGITYRNGVLFGLQLFTNHNIHKQYTLEKGYLYDPANPPEVATDPDNPTTPADKKIIVENDISYIYDDNGLLLTKNKTDKLFTRYLTARNAEYTYTYTYY